MMITIAKKFNLAAASRLRDERGISMQELIVAMALFGMLSTIVMLMVISFSRAFNDDRAATESTNVAAVGMNEITRVIRSGTEIPVPNVVANRPVFVSADRESVILHAYLDADSSTPAPVKIQLTVDPTSRDLVETRWLAYPKPGYPQYWEFNATPESSRTIARKIIVPDPVLGEVPLFTFYEVIAGVETLVPIPPGGITSTATLSRISVVEVTMKVQADATRRAEPVTLTNRVGIPNLGISRLGIS